MAHRVSPQAEAHLDAIWFHAVNESDSVQVADYLIDSITSRFLLLANYVYLGRARDDDFGVGSRSLGVGEYVIVYCVENGDALILRVVHGRRDLEAIFD